MSDLRRQDGAAIIWDYASAVAPFDGVITQRNLVPAFPQRSLPRLLTAEACGGLGSAPDCRTRRALLQGTDEQTPLGAKPWHKWLDLGTWCLAGAAFGALIGAGRLLLFHFYPAEQPKSHDQILQMAALVGVLGLPWIFSARMIAEVIFISFAEFIPGADAGLEYQARSSGIFTLALLGWFIWSGLVLWAPPVEAWIQGSFNSWVTASLAAAGGL